MKDIKGNDVSVGVEAAFIDRTFFLHVYSVRLLTGEVVAYSDKQIVVKADGMFYTTDSCTVLSNFTK